MQNLIASLGSRTDYTPLIIVAIALGVMSLITFFLYGIDKSKAKRGAWRIPEKTLLMLSFFGGALGGSLAMSLLRHKTKHWYFRFGFPAILILELAGVVFLCWYFMFR